MLKKAILDLPHEDAERYMKQCVDSGLWVPNAGDAAELSQAAAADSEKAASSVPVEEEEKFYDTVDWDWQSGRE